MKILRQITYPKDKKAKQEIPTPMTCLHYLKIVQKIIPYDGAVVGQKRPITNIDGGNNIPAKVTCCQSPAKTMSDVEVDLEIVNQVDQEHQFPQNLGNAKSERMAPVIKKQWSSETEKCGIKKLHKNY